MKKLLILIGFALIFLHRLPAQTSLPYNLRPEVPNYRKGTAAFCYPDTLTNKKRIFITLGTAAGGYGVAYTALSLAWYSDYPATKFHWFDDSHEWLQIDKMGHALGAYQGGRVMIQMLKWGGWNKYKAGIIGGMTGFITLTPLEILDGYADTWGSSISDIGANFAGGALATANELAWAEQRIQMKVSYHKSAYRDLRPDLFGDQYSGMFKDYNGHTLWFSSRIKPFLPEGKFRDKFPKWLNLAVGYGGEGMLGGYDQGITPLIREREYRQYYLSLDVDLSQIKTRSGFLDAVLGTVSVIKFPAPTLQYSAKHGLMWHWLYF